MILVPLAHDGPAYDKRWDALRVPSDKPLQVGLERFVPWTGASQDLAAASTSKQSVGRSTTTARSSPTSEVRRRDHRGVEVGRRAGADDQGPRTLGGAGLVAGGPAARSVRRQGERAAVARATPRVAVFRGFGGGARTTESPSGQGKHPRGRRVRGCGGAGDRAPSRRLVEHSVQDAPWYPCTSTQGKGRHRPTRRWGRYRHPAAVGKGNRGVVPGLRRRCDAPGPVRSPTPSVPRVQMASRPPGVLSQLRKRPSIICDLE
jgi:hypothetical protein